jgi:drug/metabolite transporter (DMT)-like permease
MKTIEQARDEQRTHSIRWGFKWAFWCACFWGLWYVPGSAIWYEVPYVNMGFETSGELLLAAAIITTLTAITVLISLYVWIGTLNKWGEYGRTFRQMKKLSKWFFIAAIFGGPCAIFGSYMAIAFIGGVFAAVAALLYPIVGATIAKLWYHEKITTRTALGIFIIVVGGVSVYAPGIIEEMTGASTQTNAWLGYLGGVMAAVGWGIEGAVAGRALDVTDPDVGITIRFTAETIYWCVLILPGVMIFTDAPVMQMISDTMNLWAIIWLLFAGFTFGFSYVCWYKAFPLIGVGRGQAIASFYGVFAVVYLTIFTLDLPQWNFLLGLGLAIIGGFIMFYEDESKMEVVRDV